MKLDLYMSRPDTEFVAKKRVTFPQIKGYAPKDERLLIKIRERAIKNAIDADKELSNKLSGVPTIAFTIDQCANFELVKATHIPLVDGPEKHRVELISLYVPPQ